MSPMKGSRRRRLVLLAAAALAALAAADDWPQWRGPTRDGRWYETGLVEHFAAAALEPTWRVAVAPGYTSPTVAAGRVFLSDRPDADHERVLCVDAATGEARWEHRYECRYSGISSRAGPRAAITIHDGRAYALGAMGHLHCLAADTGAVFWSKDLSALYAIQMPVWGIAAAPVIEGPLLLLQIGGREGAGVVALDRLSGEERWKALPDRASYATPLIIDQAGQRVAVCWTAQRIVGLAVNSGRLLWETAFPEPARLVAVADPVLDQNRLFFSDYWEGSLMLRVDPKRPAVSRLWYRKGASDQQTDALHAMITTPILDGEALYGVDSHGELRGLRAADGERLWESLELLPKLRWGTMHFVRNRDRVWIFTEKGDLAITRLTPDGLTVLSRARLIEPTKAQHARGVVWSHPAFANRAVFCRNDRELLCASLAAP
ncbi:MAG: PQQ-binding-like beta-propeller repeat protein [Lentisphaerae bacterium]|nr:PQQ-binding-like beta-propeller repeat protein [Lentisphaerota bacterium]